MRTNSRATGAARKSAALATRPMTYESYFVFELPVFLLGIGHESPLQQHAAFLSIPLQHECAFRPRLPRLVLFLQQDMAASLQQSFMSQQASAVWLVFCGGFRDSPAAETANMTALVSKHLK